MTKFRLLSLLCSLAVLGLGFIYLTVGDTSLAYVLPLMSLAFWTIAVLQYADVRAAGARGILALLPAAAMALVAAFSTLGTLVYLIE